jgi:hypothetical protein
MDNVVTINHTKENKLEFELTMDGVENKDTTVMMMIESKGMVLGFKAEHKEKDTWTVKLPKLPMLERTAYQFHITVDVDGYHFEPFQGTCNVVGSAKIYSSDPKNVTLQPTEEKKPEPKKEEKKEAPKKAVKKKTAEKEAPKKDVKKDQKKDDKKDVTEADTAIHDSKAAQAIRDAIAAAQAATDLRKNSPARKVIEEQKHKPVDELAREFLEQQKFTPEAVNKKVEQVREAVAEADKHDHENDDKVLAILEEVGITPMKKKRRRFSLMKH